MRMLTHFVIFIIHKNKENISPFSHRMLATLIPHLYKYWIITIQSTPVDSKTSVIYVSSNFI